MSNHANTLPDPETAYATLFNGVHSEVFFNKLAAAGFAPRSEQEAMWMLETAGKLRAVSETQQVKQAGMEDNPFYRMNASLDKVLDHYGLGQTKQASRAEVETGYKQAAARLMQDPTFYNSVLSLKAHEAQELKNQFDASQRR